jgi:hypothetical protein
VHADEREYRGTADKAGRASTKRIDVIKQSNRATDLSVRCTKCDTRIGSVAPISNVGNDDKQRLTAAVAGNGQLTTRSPTSSKALNDTMPKVAVAISMAASNGRSLIPLFFEIQPPAGCQSPGQA